MKILTLEEIIKVKHCKDLISHNKSTLKIFEKEIFNIKNNMNDEKFKDDDTEGVKKLLLKKINRYNISLNNIIENKNEIFNITGLKDF